VRVLTAVIPVRPDAQPLCWRPDPYQVMGTPTSAFHLCSYLDTSAPQHPRPALREALSRKKVTKSICRELVT
jgi:hypothetical protein